MELLDLGFTKWFQQHHETYHRPDLQPARITRVDRDRYLVRNTETEVQAEPVGKLLFAIESSEDLPCVGDWALVQYYNEGTLAIIHELLPRKSFLRRKAAGKKVDYQMIASNIDVAFIMQSCDSNFNLRRMERYLIMIHEGKIEPIILLSKSDLVNPEELESIITKIKHDHIDTTVIPFSNTTGSGLQSVQQILQKAKTYCLLGSSGVGKTTLLNHLLKQDVYKTNPVREKDDRGKHTTTYRQLTLLENGALLIDTPGMRELGMLAAESSIDDSFSDIHELAGDCHFRDCTHTSETGCAILQSIQDGILDEERYHSYLKLRKESEFNQLSLVERRRKDRQFGRMINTAMKDLKKVKPRV